MGKNIVIGFVLLGVVAFLFVNFNSQRLGVIEKKETKTLSKKGKVLAGTLSPYIEFNKVEYDKAISEGKIVFLDFYANWCPICRAEQPELLEGFNELTRDDIVGFRVNFKDDQTDSDETALAAQFRIPYQHHKIILKAGKEILRSGDQWDKETFLNETAKL